MLHRKTGFVTGFQLGRSDRGRGGVACQSWLLAAGATAHLLQAPTGWWALMLTVVIEAGTDADALVRTLGSLVPGAVEGAVREVILCDGHSSAHIERIADQAGCHYLGGAHVSTGIAKARSDWLLFLEPGSRMADGWIEAVLAHMAGEPKAARFTRSRHSRGSFLGRLIRRQSLREGLLVPRNEVAAIATNGQSADAIARRISARRLSAEIVVAPVRS